MDNSTLLVKPVPDFYVEVESPDIRCLDHRAEGLTNGISILVNYVTVSHDRGLLPFLTETLQGKGSHL